MIEEVAEVVEVGSTHLFVRSARLSACNGCQASDNCSQRSLAKLFGNHHVLIRLSNPESLPVRVGQSVVVGLHERALLLSSVVMYLVPLLFLILFAVLSATFFQQESFIIASTLMGLLLGFLMSRKLSKKLLSNANYTPKLVRIAQ